MSKRNASQLEDDDPALVTGAGDVNEAAAERPTKRQRVQTADDDDLDDAELLAGVDDEAADDIGDDELLAGADDSDDAGDQEGLLGSTEVGTAAEQEAASTAPLPLLAGTDVVADAPAVSVDACSVVATNGDPGERLLVSGDTTETSSGPTARDGEDEAASTTANGHATADSSSGTVVDDTLEEGSELLGDGDDGDLLMPGDEDATSEQQDDAQANGEATTATPLDATESDSAIEAQQAATQPSSAISEAPESSETAAAPEPNTTELPESTTESSSAAEVQEAAPSALSESETTTTETDPVASADQAPSTETVEPPVDSAPTASDATQQAHSQSDTATEPEGEAQAGEQATASTPPGTVSSDEQPNKTNEDSSAAETPQVGSNAAPGWSTGFGSAFSSSATTNSFASLASSGPNSAFSAKPATESEAKTESKPAFVAFGSASTGFGTAFGGNSTGGFTALDPGSASAWGEPERATATPAEEEDEGDDDAGVFEKEKGTQPSNGEENEHTVFKVRAKLFQFDAADKRWRELGTGPLKVNQRVDSLAKIAPSRIIIRRETTTGGKGTKLLLNAAIFKGMLVEDVNEKCLRVTCVPSGQPLSIFLVKLSRRDERKELKDTLHRLAAEEGGKLSAE